MSVRIHCCPAGHKWTPKPTLNKKSQDCLEIMYLFKKQRPPSIFKNMVFLQKFICALWANIAKVIFLSNVGSGRSRQRFGLFSCKTMVCVPMTNIAQYFFCIMFPLRDTFKKHWLDNILIQCCPSMVNKILHRLFFSQKLSVSHGPTLNM